MTPRLLDRLLHTCLWRNPSSLGGALDLIFPEPSHEEEDALEAICQADDSHNSALRLLATLLSRTLSTKVGVQRDASVVGLVILVLGWGGNASRMLERISEEQLRDIEPGVLRLREACLRDVVRRREANEAPDQVAEARIAEEIDSALDGLRSRASTSSPGVSAQATNHASGPARALRFEGDDPLGKGADGEVWRGRDDIRALAVKLFPGSDGAMQRALEHAKALARVDHPNVVKAHYVDVVRHPKTGEVVPCIATELVEGETIGQRLEAAAARPLDMAEALRVGLALIDGINGIHTQGAVHGDLYRENVMLTRGGSLKIIDPKPGVSLRRLSSAPRAVRLRGDVDDVVDICEELLRTAGAEEQTLLAFDNAIGGRRRTLDDVRAAFMAATGAAGSAPPLPEPSAAGGLAARIALLEQNLSERRQEEDEEQQYQDRRLALVHLRNQAWNLSQSAGRHVLNEERAGRRTPPAGLAELKSAAQELSRLVLRIDGWQSQLERTGEYENARVDEARKEVERVRALFGFDGSRGSSSASAPSQDALDVLRAAAALGECKGIVLCVSSEDQVATYFIGSAKVVLDDPELVARMESALESLVERGLMRGHEGRGTVTRFSRLDVTAAGYATAKPLPAVAAWWEALDGGADH